MGRERGAVHRRVSGWVDEQVDGGMGRGMNEQVHGGCEEPVSVHCYGHTRLDQECDSGDLPRFMEKGHRQAFS